jgi:hypothetical protein
MSSPSVCSKPINEYCRKHRPAPKETQSVSAAEAKMNTFFKDSALTLATPATLATPILATDYAEYHSETIRILDNIGSILKDLPNNAIGEKLLTKYDGRDGATSFEKTFLKPTLFNVRNKNKIMKTINKMGDSYELLDIFDYKDTVVDETEVENRTFADIGLRISNRQGNESIIPINIKATKGNTSDNVGGWLAYEFMMFGDNQSKGAQKDALLEKVTKDSLSHVNVASDYFLWSFTKGKDRPFTNSYAFSILEFEPQNFSFNPVQSFPMQANVTKLIPHRSAVTSAETLYDRRLKLSLWLVDNYDAYHEAQSAKRKANRLNLI